MQSKYYEYADEAQANLIKNYWNEEAGTFYDKYPQVTADVLNYWWIAHAIDTLTDAYIRTGDDKYKEYADKALETTIARNKGKIINDYYDDMQWMAIALLRLYDHTREAKYLTHIVALWGDIKEGENEYMGGGIAWRKQQLYYKNTPANAPAAIFAARYYNSVRDPEDLVWAKRLFAFVDENLTDKQTGEVWDGINRQEDGEIDKAWCFTYCHGVYIGAAVELYKITGEQEYLDKAIRTAEFSLTRFIGENGTFTETGEGDGGLFKGILIRYLVELYKIIPDYTGIRGMLYSNLDILRENGTSKDGRIGSSWTHAPSESDGFDLSVQLSATMLYEMAAVIDAMQE